MRILVTGAAGYIGSHTCLELLQGGYDVTAVDNLSNSKEASLLRVQDLAGRSLEFFQIDLRDREVLSHVFDGVPIDAVIHFAGLKSVNESVASPLSYYQNNVIGSLSLFDVMKAHNVKDIIFSSSATVYGKPSKLPLGEDAPLSVTNPYGRCKLMIEHILKDIHQADTDWNIVILRYFNRVGAHSSGRIGEDPVGIPNNLLPSIMKVAVGELPELVMYGNDYPTVDGTGVRDYLHVVDLAIGHMQALSKLISKCGVAIYNLGTGRGYSVLEIIRSVERVSGVTIPYRIDVRRSGDVAACYADVSKARNELDWSAMRSVDEMCADAWRWQINNPHGYERMPSLQLQRTV